MNPDEFRLILVDPQCHLCEAWRREFGDAPEVQVVHGRFEELDEFDCLVSAANSFGLMDGGVDLAITRYFGPELMKRVQARILDEWRGEQPVGTSFIVETGDPAHPFLAHTPTMRVPMDISKTDNVYQAMGAMLVAVWRHNRAATTPIRCVACPGLGTATGAVPFDEAARQMQVAYRRFRTPLTQISWPDVVAREQAIARNEYNR